MTKFLIKKQQGAGNLGLYSKTTDWADDILTDRDEYEVLTGTKVELINHFEELSNHFKEDENDCVTEEIKDIIRIINVTECLEDDVLKICHNYYSECELINYTQSPTDVADIENFQNFDYRHSCVQIKEIESVIGIAPYNIAIDYNNNIEEFDKIEELIEFLRNDSNFDMQDEEFDDKYPNDKTANAIDWVQVFNQVKIYNKILN